MLKLLWASSSLIIISYLAVHCAHITTWKHSCNCLTLTLDTGFWGGSKSQSCLVHQNGWSRARPVTHITLRRMCAARVSSKWNKQTQCIQCFTLNCHTKADANSANGTDSTVDRVKVNCTDSCLVTSMRHIACLLLTELFRWASSQVPNGQTGSAPKSPGKCIAQYCRTHIWSQLDRSIREQTSLKQADFQL